MSQIQRYCNADEISPNEYLELKVLNLDVPDMGLLAGDILLIDLRQQPTRGALSWFIHSDGDHSIALYNPAYEDAYNLAAVYPIVASTRDEIPLPDGITLSIETITQQARAVRSAPI